MKIIRGGTVVTAVDIVLADVLIDGETIAGVGNFDGVDAEVLDATGCFVLPGAIDNHTHLSMPFGGTATRRRLRHGHAGRGRRRHDLPRRLRAADGARTACARRSSSGWAAPRAPRTSTTASTWRSRRPTPARSPTWRRWSTRASRRFKVFLAYPNVLMVTDDHFLAVLERSTETGGARRWCTPRTASRSTISCKKALAAGDTDPIYHALTRPEEFEAEATGRAMRLAEFAGAPIYIVHVSCKSAVDEIIRARARGVQAYGETCIQYLFDSIDDLRRPDFEGARYVCSPPLRDAANQPHLWDALNFDHLQSISTDHCPFNDEQKRLGLGDFSKIPNGLAAIQHRLPMLWEHGVREGRLTLNRVVEVTSTAIAKIFGLHPRKGTIAPGADADIVDLRPRREHVFSPATSFMNVDYDLCEGQEVAGSPRLDALARRRSCSTTARSSRSRATGASCAATTSTPRTSSRRPGRRPRP